VNNERNQPNDTDGSLSAAFDPISLDSMAVTRLTYGRHIRVLLVDDDPQHAAAFVDAARESVLDVTVDTVDTIEDALARLERSGTPRLRRQPDVIVVSLEISEAHRLLEMTNQHDGKRLPTLVLAKHASPVAERRSFALGATAHLVAPRRDYERVALIHALPDFIPSARAFHAHLEHRR
jgi:CheY-like chemotaxis protein